MLHGDVPRRLIVERRFGWMTRWHHLVRAYKARVDDSEVMIHLTMSSLLLRRIAP